MYETTWWRIEGLEKGPVRHGGRILRRAERPAFTASDLDGTSLWRAGNHGSNELDLQRTLLLPQNEPLLRHLGEAPDDLALVGAAREVGGAGSIDVAALYRSKGAQRLLLVDCKNAKPHSRSKILEQQVQARRIAQSTISNVMLDRPLHPSEVCLVLLAGAGKKAALPREVREMPSPGWFVGGAFTTIEPPVTWAYLPVLIARGGRRQEWVAVQRWATEPGAEGAHHDDDLWGSEWARQARKLNGKAKAELASSDSFRSYKLSAELHSEALIGEESASEEALGIRQILKEGRSGAASLDGWRYVGETNDKGCVRLWWERLGTAKDDALVRYLTSRNLNPRKFDR